jgi:hypothetical protein
MSWTFNGVRLYVQEKSNDVEQIIARLNPVSGPTILHRWGRESEVLSLNALVLTSGDITLLDALTASATSYPFNTPEGSGGMWILNKLSWDRHESINHTFFDRPALDSNTPLYRVSMELYLDET